MCRSSMTGSVTPRRLTLAAATAACFALTAFDPARASAHDGIVHVAAARIATPAAAAGERTASMSSLYSAMQTLWAQHVEWTYAAVAAYVFSPQLFEATAARLMQNQEDIGNAIKPSAESVRRRDRRRDE